MSQNQDLFDRQVDHAAMMHMVEAKTQVNTKREIRSHRSRLSKLMKRKGFFQRSEKEYIPEIASESRRFTTKLSNDLNSNMQDIGRNEVDFTTNTLHKTLGPVANILRPQATMVLTDIVGANVRGNGTLARQIQKLGASELKRIKTTIDQGLRDGLSTKKLTQQVLRATRLTESQASALVRTSVTQTQVISQLASFQANKDVLKGMMFTAVLDDRTSAICAHHDGNVYAIDDLRFAPPLHWRCRSTLVPVAKSAKELLDSAAPQIKRGALQRLSDALAAKMTSALPKREDYGQWLSRQSRETKVRHFQGDLQKVDLFDLGQIPLKSFTTASGKLLSLTALRRIDNKNTNVTPTKQKTFSKNAVNNLQIGASRPSQLLRSKKQEEELKDFFRAESNNSGSLLALTDFRGTSIPGKRATRRRANNQFDERNVGVDPLTGEQKSTLIYDPDFQVFQERLDFLSNSKVLKKDEKEWIKNFVISLENDGISVNQQSAIVENLRIIFERYSRDRRMWESLSGVIRSELKNSVVNTSRILDRRSRSRSNLFKLNGNASDSQVQILGQWTSFQDMADRTLANQRLVDDFAAKQGLPIARKLYSKGRSPLRSYFPKLPNFLPQLPSVREAILAQIEKLPFGKAFVNKYNGVPSDPLITRFLQAGNEKKRRFLDLEWIYTRKREDFAQKALTPNFAKKRIKLLAEIITDVATGKSTDYDAISIQIGKKIFEAEKSDFDILFKEPSIQNYHKVGSDILQGLKDQGKITVGLRGTTRRGINDLESGRPQVGSYADTISREVKIIDPDLLKLQRANSELVYSRRIGIVNQRDRLTVKAGHTKFFDSRGRKTSQSVITRKAGANYDQNLVDKDFSRMLNHVMDFEWEIDQDFGLFFDKLISFRDPRGRVEYYDDLNSYRKVVLQRGEAGSGLVQSVRWHLNNKSSWRNWAQIDGRGRVYTQGYLHPAGGEFVRPFLNTKLAKNIDSEVLQELRIQLGTLVGDAFDVLDNTGRIDSFRKNEKAFLELGEIMLSKTQSDRRIREFLEHPLIRATEAEEVPKLARFALEYTRIYNHVEGDFSNTRKLNTYKTQLGNENDASASGAQLIALSTRDRALANASNILATDRKNRLYDLVAERTISDPEFQRINPFGNDLSFGDMAKAAKGQSMVAFYGAGQATQAGAIEGKLAKVLGGKGYLVITKPELSNFNKEINNSIKYAEQGNTPSVAAALKQLRLEVNNSINNNVPIGNKLLVQTRDIHPDSEQFVAKLTNVRGSIVGPNQFKDIAKIMSKHLKDIAPVTENFVSFWKEVADVYVTESKLVDIPWVTVDGKLLFQRYRPTVQERISFVDPVTGRRVSNIYEDSITDSKFLGRSSVIDARTGLGVNGNHMNDASIVRKFHLWGKKNDVFTATIHDGFFTNLADSTAAKWKLREIYADAVEGDTLLNTLKAMRARGLTEESFQRLMKRAKELGLLDPENGITAEDILAEVPDGWDFYGIGP
jgi:SPP1 gp7 family putative phage head morphogenesis protein